MFQGTHGTLMSLKFPFPDKSVIKLKKIGVIVTFLHLICDKPLKYYLRLVFCRKMLKQ